MGDKDIVLEARELASAITDHTLSNQERLRDLLTALADEVTALRKHVEGLNHDFESSNKFCDEHHVLGSE